MTDYAGKIGTLKDLFGTDDLSLEADVLRVGGKRYPILDGVIILSDPSQHTDYVRSRLGSAPDGRGLAEKGGEFAADIQSTFGAEWGSYGEVLPEHGKEFSQYFDLVDLDSLQGKRVCDLGCGNGRWSFFLKGRCRELVLVDFSDAIFVAKKNLAGADDCLFFMGDLTRLPFREGFCDFLFCIGVLHHLPVPALEEVRRLKRYAPELLIYLYYALDNRPFYFRTILKAVTGARAVLSRVKSPMFRKVFSKTGTYGLYLPLVGLGKLLEPFGWSSHVPLYDGYHDKTSKRIEQDVYDRFFTRIEQRVSRQEIYSLREAFSQVTVSDKPPYWHFLCKN